MKWDPETVYSCCHLLEVGHTKPRTTPILNVLTELAQRY